jgi:hypothetical protein
VRFLALLLFAGCATARVIGPEVVKTPDPGLPRLVVIEPFFETAQWRVEVEKLQTGGIGMAGTTTIVKTVKKPVLAQVPSLVEEHRRVLEHVKKLRPSWRVSSTGGLQAVEGELSLVRVIIESSQIIETDRSLKNTAFAFWPLQIYNFWPVTETERAYGTLERYLTNPPAVKERLVRYQTQPDFAFDAKGLAPLKREFGLDITYEEGLLADEGPRGPVLIEGFSERLASAIVAIVEEP